MSEPSIQIDNLEFRYPTTSGYLKYEASSQQLYLPKLNFFPGEIAILLGENGSGKTTLLKLIAGFLQPTRGSIITSDPPVLVHQKPYIFQQSLRSNMIWPLKIQHKTKPIIQKQVKEMVDRLQLTHLVHRWAPNLSGGEKQRLAIARALIVSPKILLLDEPTSNIDNNSAQTIEQVLLESAKQGSTILMSTHNRSSAYRLANRIISIKSGKLEEPTENIFSGRMIPNKDHQSDYIGTFQITNGPLLYCPLVEQEYRTAVISMNDIFLSESRIHSSAQNRFEGTILSLDQIDLGLIRVVIHIGISICALVTSQSKSKLHLEVGKNIHVTFKASAVRLY